MVIPLLANQDLTPMLEVTGLNFVHDGRWQTFGDRIYLLLYHAEAALQSIVSAAAMLFPCGGMHID